MGRLSENSVLSIKNRSFSVTAEVDVPAGGANGVIIAPRAGGSADGRSWCTRASPTFCYNVLGIQSFAARTAHPRGQPPDACSAYDGGGLAKGGDVTLYHDGSAVGPGRVEHTQPLVFSTNKTTDIGYESGTTLSPDYTTDSSWIRRQDPPGAARSRRRR